MRKTLWIRILAAVLILCIAGFLIVRAYSDTLTLCLAGLRADGSEVYHGFDANDREIRVTRTATTDGTLTVAILSKNPWGFWTVDSRNTVDETHPHWADATWITAGGTVYYNGALSGGATIHYVFCGNNAVKLIQFEEGQLPDNVTVDLDQWAGGGFWVHVTYVALPGADGASFDIHEALIENGCIPAE